MKLNEILNIKYPIIQGGMANISDGTFAAAVSNAGALGVIAAGGLDKDELRAEIHKCRELTDKPFGVNLMIQSRYMEKWNQVVLEEQVPVVTTGAGNPGPYIEAWKDKGIKVFPVVPNMILAERMSRLKIDGLIVEGLEAGGHIGDMTTMTALPEIAANIDVPVIAAGGIATGRQMLATEVLGAVGVQIGSLFLATDECPIDQEYKERIIKARSTHTVIVGGKTGFPARVLRSPMTRKYNELENQGKDKWELEEFLLGGLKRAVNDGDWQRGSFMVGQVVGVIKEIAPIKDVLERLEKEYLDAKNSIERI